MTLHQSWHDETKSTWKKQQINGWQTHIIGTKNIKLIKLDYTSGRCSLLGSCWKSNPRQALGCRSLSRQVSKTIERAVDDLGEDRDRYPGGRANVINHTPCIEWNECGKWKTGVTYKGGYDHNGWREQSTTHCKVYRSSRPRNENFCVHNFQQNTNTGVSANKCSKLWTQLDSPTSPAESYGSNRHSGHSDQHRQRDAQKSENTRPNGTGNVELVRTCTLCKDGCGKSQISGWARSRKGNLFRRII